jgi:D-inositol-3-phosphate glycosyltransferase
MNKNLAILCSSGSWGGLEINTLRLAGWMRQRGWKPTIYSPADSILTLNAKKSWIPVFPLNKPFRYFDLIGAWKLHKNLLKNKTEILFVCNNRDLSLAAWSKFFSGNKLKIIYQQHMQIGISKKDFIHTLRFSKIDAWLAPLFYLAEEVKTKTKFDPKKIHIVPFCIQTENFYPPKIPKNEARKILKLPLDKKIIGTIGRLDPQKAAHICIEALAKLENLQDLHLMILGEKTKGEDDTYEKKLHELTKKYNLQERVHFRPFTEDLHAAFSALDMFIMPSLNETYGMVTIEAMLSGIPVMGADSGGTRELLGYGTMGILFLPGNAFDLARKIKQVLIKFEPLKLMAVSAQEYVAEEFSHHRECELIEEVIKKLEVGRGKLEVKKGRWK